MSQQPSDDELIAMIEALRTAAAYVVGPPSVEAVSETVKSLAVDPEPRPRGNAEPPCGARGVTPDPAGVAGLRESF